MPNVNKVFLIGHVGKDPEMRYTSGGKAVANFSLATTQKWDGGEKTQWHRIVVWERLAELCEKYVRKGSPLYVEGSIEYREWVDKEGGKRYAADIVARVIQFLGKREGGSVERQSPPVADSDDDIPF